MTDWFPIWVTPIGFPLSVYDSSKLSLVGLLLTSSVVADVKRYVLHVEEYGALVHLSTRMFLARMW